MSSLNASNESAGWFHNIASKFNIGWMTALPRISARLILIFAGIVIIIWLWPSFLHNSGIEGLLATDGKIIVNSPTVYTRQRLVNDRLEQARWLKQQLAAADGLGDAKFRSIDAIRTSQQGRIVSFQAASEAGVATPNKIAEAGGETQQSGSGAANGEKPPAAANALAGISVDMTTAALFRAKNSFRDEVRAEMMETQLDDRHDILGNTIYRLAFDATVLAGKRKDSLAGIKITLSHNPDRQKVDEPQKRLLKIQYEEDYKQLYVDWARHMQVLISSGLDVLAGATINNKPDPRMKLLFTKFLIGRVCEFFLDFRSLGNTIHPDCDPQASDTGGAASEESKARKLSAERNRAKAGALVSKYIENHLDFLKAIAAAQAEVAFKFLVKRNLLQPEDQAYFQELVRRTCINAINANGNSITLQDLGLDFGAAAADAKTDSGAASQEAYKPGILCLSTPSDEPIWAGIYLYNYLYSVGAHDMNSEQNSNAVQSRDAGKSPEEILKSVESFRDERNCRRFKAADSGPTNETKCFVPDRDVHAIRCFVADFLRAYLDAFDRPTANRVQHLSTFLNIKLVGREVNDCQLRVSTLDAADSVATELALLLNSATETFAYSVSPKNLSENINTATEARNVYELVARSRLGSKVATDETVAKLLHDRSDWIKGVVEHPIIVGFSSGSQFLEALKGVSPDTLSPRIPETNFGWIIAPHSRPDHESEQIDEQYPLTAVISVPSWWRSVELDIESCWIARADLGKSAKANDGAVNICTPGSEHHDWTVIRLPGVAQEVSQKLGFEVLEEPYVTGVTLSNLVVGQPGSLLLNGMRLWRGTDVTLGAQRASSIVILPNMEGIIANFDCVLPQFTDDPDKEAKAREYGHDIHLAKDAYGRDIHVSQLSGRVWTSEGVTDPFAVTLQWPSDGAQDNEKSAGNHSSCLSGGLRSDGTGHPGPAMKNNVSAVLQ